jgi:hypothetical protein
MSDQLTAPPASSSNAGRPRASWSTLLPYAVQAVAIVLLLAAVGALAGVVWEWVWHAPTGIVVNHHWVQDEDGLRGSFSGTGTYVIVATLAGLPSGLAIGLLLDRSPLVTLVAVAVGSLLAGWVMLHVGVALGPDDPHQLAAGAKDMTELPARLAVSGASPWRVFPASALIGLLVAFLGFSPRRASHP